MRAIVTGHSRGLGAAIAATLLARGIVVLGISRGRNAGLAERHPDTLKEMSMDLADTSSLADWLESADFDSFAGGDEPILLINNAGVLQPTGFLGAQRATSIAAAVQINVATPLMLANAVMRVGTVDRERRLLHVSSGAARTPYAGWSVYCATKAALDQHARAVALEGHPGLRICSLAPGVIDTEMQSEVRGLSVSSFPARDRFISLKASNQLTSPDEACNRVVGYLLSLDFGILSSVDLRGLVCV